jgi:hypothetical protein
MTLGIDGYRGTISVPLRITRAARSESVDPSHVGSSEEYEPI